MKALIVCQFSPYPVVTGGYERLIADWQSHVFADYDTYFLCNRQKHAPNRLFHRGQGVAVSPTLRELRAHDFALALFINPLDDEPEIALADDVPSFCFLERQRPAGRFLGTITHSGRASDDVLAGGADPPEELERIAPYIDGAAVLASGAWLSAAAIAALLNRARLFVNASPKESFCIALVEAM